MNNNSYLKMMTFEFTLIHTYTDIHICVCVVNSRNQGSTNTNPGHPSLPLLSTQKRQFLLASAAPERKGCLNMACPPASPIRLRLAFVAAPSIQRDGFLSFCQRLLDFSQTLYFRDFSCAEWRTKKRKSSCKSLTFHVLSGDLKKKKM